VGDVLTQVVVLLEGDTGAVFEAFGGQSVRRRVDRGYKPPITVAHRAALTGWVFGVAQLDRLPAIRQVGKGAGASRREAVTTVHGVVRRHRSLLLTMDLIVGDPGAREVTGTIVRRTSGADTRVLLTQ
jgi:hypothetical protein